MRWLVVLMATSVGVLAVTEEKACSTQLSVHLASIVDQMTRMMNEIEVRMDRMETKVDKVGEKVDRNDLRINAVRNHLQDESRNVLERMDNIGKNTLTECKAGTRQVLQKMDYFLNVGCGSPENLQENGVNFSPTQTQFNSHVTFSCKDRTRSLHGAPAAVCLRTGKWSTPTPKCYKPCSHGNIGFGSWKDKSVTISPHGARAGFQCNAPVFIIKFRPVPSDGFTTCDDGTWKPYPTCQSARG